MSKSPDHIDVHILHYIPARRQGKSYALWKYLKAYHNEELAKPEHKWLKDKYGGIDEQDQPN